MTVREEPHLPDIGAFADAHLHVEKTERDGRTETLVEPLSPEARREEMAQRLRLAIGLEFFSF